MDEKEADKPEEGASPSDTAAEPPEPVRSAGTAKREDQIQNAVAFLSHPKVSFKGSVCRLLTLNAHYLVIKCSDTLRSRFAPPQLNQSGPSCKRKV